MEANKIITLSLKEIENESKKKRAHWMANTM